MNFPLPSTDPLGTDLQLDENGDLIVDIAGSLCTVTDTDNAVQAIRVHIQTVPSTYIWDGNVGSNLAAYIDEPITAENEKSIQDAVTSILLQDTRILSVSKVEIDDSQSNMLVVFVSAVVNGIGDVMIPITIGGA